MNNIHKFFEDFNKLFYWSLIVISWLLTADIIGNLFFNKSINEIFTKINFSELLIISASQIIIIFTIITLYELIKFISVFVPKISSTDSNDDLKKFYISYDELLDKAIKDNNQTMYNYYKDAQKEIRLHQNQKYLCWTVFFLLILNFCIEKNTLSIIAENYNKYGYFKKMIISFLIMVDFLGLILFLLKRNNLYYSDIKK